MHSPDNSPVFHIVALLFRMFGVSDGTLFIFQTLTSIWLITSFFFARYLVFSGKDNPQQRFNFLPSILVFVLGFLYPKQSWALGFLALSFGFYSTTATNKKPSLALAKISFFSSSLFQWVVSGILFLVALWFHPMVALLGLGVFILYQIPEKFYLFIFCFGFFLPFLLPEDPSGRFYSEKENFPLVAAFALAGPCILWDWTFLVFGSSPPKFRRMRKALAFFGFLLLFPVFHFADIQYRILLSLILLNQIYIQWNILQILVWMVSSGLWIFTIFINPNQFRYSYEEMWIPGESMASVPNNGLLVAHHGFCEYYHFQFNKDCLSFEPDAKAISELPKDTEIYRAVYGIRYENLLSSKDENKKPIFSFIKPLGDYQLVREQDWKKYRLSLEKRNSKLLLVAKSWKNPYKERPDFIKRKHTNGL
nr:hypothetical protein [Leptospira soteropolitanensis]